ncbi:MULTISPECIES: OmpA family protein [Pseudomonas]|jgi:OOP family OmpA-OmpF porin|uniref:OmpA family protein n=2 Tax=Pseudomonas fluorescens group TaxID=136843 RepID=A0AB36CS87_9PSED|nr:MULTISPECIES: OmpA family protein [Pseudomonas]MBU0523659.1 OmpA family protein [Gammaproteobacteria bacterium]MDF9882687.1 outer membrane protein OmpA-like peptidoglycan-associated protein [Pseudomonas silensiensis]MBA4364247.1 OmpA family protein [Pseudomonas sp.]MBU0820937.1 OmpA family protein [Gammaproteobacteria bacterium]MBU0844680.1 OmpA family protein [Gammaproteobacteria bacterium]
MSVLTRTVLPVLLLGSLLTGCATHSDGTAPLNQRTWPICSLIGGLVGGGLGAIESAGWAGGGAALGILTGGLICYAQDGDEDEDGVFDRRDRCPDTPANTPVEHHGCPLPQYPASVKPVEVVEPEVITLPSDVLFAFNKSDLSPAAQSQLDSLMSKLQFADVVSIKVIGHTDSVGSDEYNQALSERRASSVAAYLLSQGIAPSKLTSEGKGESQPLADNETDEGRAKNRRVELHINR